MVSLAFASQDTSFSSYLTPPTTMKLFLMPNSAVKIHRELRHCPRCHSWISPGEQCFNALLRVTGPAIFCSFFQEESQAHCLSGGLG